MLEHSDKKCYQYLDVIYPVLKGTDDSLFNKTTAL
jgi:hypothetical protein